MSPDCPYFLRPKEKLEFKKHLDTWRGRCPKGFHIFVLENINKEAEDIYLEAKNKYGA